MVQSTPACELNEPEPPDKSREMHFAIRFLTRYEYDADVVDNINALRVRPATNSRQRVDDFTVRLTPDARQYRHEDYFGTEVSSSRSRARTASWSSTCARVSPPSPSRAAGDDLGGAA